MSELSKQDTIDGILDIIQACKFTGDDGQEQLATINHAKAKLALADFIKREVIGEDETPKYGAQDTANYRNWLRVKQRARVDALLTSNEGKL